MSGPGAPRPPADATAPVALLTALVRPAAIAAVSLTVLAVLAATSGAAVSTGGAGVLAVGVGLLTDRRAGRSTASGSATLVVGVVLIGVAARDLLEVELESIDPFLLVSAFVVSVLAIALRERRFASLAIVQLAIVAGRPRAGEGFSHCLIARDLVVPVPRLDALLAVGLLGLAGGLLARRLGAREASRGYQVTGLALGLGTLVLKAVELPGLEILCGRGDATDDGWVVLALLAGLLAAAAGAATRDLTVLALGGTTLGVTGLAATALDQQPLWAIAAALPFVAALVRSDRLGVPWPPRRTHHGTEAE